MQFCPKCDNILDISKTQPKAQSLLNSTPSALSETTNFDKDVEKLLTAYKNKEDLTNYNIDINQLSNHSLFLKLKDVDRNKILKSINQEIIDESKTAYYICKNCFYSEKIKSNTLVLSRMNMNISSYQQDLSKYKYMIHDKTLPHTRDYICHNKDCPSHTDFSKRDAVWFRPILNSYSTYYGCVCCSTIWNVS